MKHIYSASEIEQNQTFIGRKY